MRHQQLTDCLNLVAKMTVQEAGDPTGAPGNKEAINEVLQQLLFFVWPAVTEVRPWAQGKLQYLSRKAGRLESAA